MLKKYVILFLFAIICALPFSYGQEVIVFKVEDFDLKGNVKSCLVITDYGKEEYYFEETDKLTKSVTRFNDSDYETTYYKYNGSDLVERRVENYLDNTFDSATSLANFYTIDTTANRKITEKIISYEKELLEQNIFLYDEEEKLVSIERTNTNGTDEHKFVYSEGEGEKTVREERNGILLETIQTLSEKSENDSLQKKVLTQKYLDGQVNSKTVQVFDSNGKLLSQTEELYDGSIEKWILQEDLKYSYAENGVLANVKSQQMGYTTTKEYIYQFDGTDANNWVKEIVTPNNTYKTRRIAYHEIPVAEQQEEEN